MMPIRLRTLAQQANFAVLTTFMPDGMPQSTVMWVDADDSALILNTEAHRQKYRNVLRDPRVTVVVVDRADPYRYIEARGRVTAIVTGPAARAHIDRLSDKYRGEPYRPRIRSERVLLRVVPTRVVLGNSE